MQTDRIWLGTALWAWAVERPDAFALLDRFVQAGGIWVDTATNYPIDGQASHFGAAAALLSEWLRANPGSPVKVMCKIGSLDNLGSPLHMLDGSGVTLAAEFAWQRFGDALGGLGIHWDNREAPEQVAATVEALRRIGAGRLKFGLSGIRRPDLYASLAPDLAKHWRIQVKDNFATRAAYDHYASHLPEAKYIAYGINMGGVKSTGQAAAASSLQLRRLTEPTIASHLRAALETFDRGGAEFPRDLHDLAIIRVASASRLAGCIIGPRNVMQSDRSLSCWAWATTASRCDLAPSLALIASVGHISVGVQ